jgi:Sigma-70 factor, region 1.1
MISTSAFDRLMQLGRQHDGLKTDDLRQALPIDTMTVEEIADVVARLEDAGISVDVDAGLLTPHHRKIILPQAEATPLSLRSEQATINAHLASSIKAAKENSYRTREPARPHLQKFGTIFVVAAALILILLGLVVWRLV